MATVDDIFARLGLTTLTPGLVERSRATSVREIYELDSTGTLEIGPGSVVYVAPHRWQEVGTPATFAQQIRANGGIAVVVDNDDLGLPPEFVQDCVRSALPVLVLPRTASAADLRAAVRRTGTGRLNGDENDSASEMRALLARFAGDSGTEVWLAMSGCLISGAPAAPPTARTLQVLGHQPTRLSTSSLHDRSLRIELDRGASIIVLNPDRRPVARRSLEVLCTAVTAWLNALHTRRTARLSIEAALIRELVEANTPPATLDPWVRSFGFTKGARVRAIVLAVDCADAQHLDLVNALHDVAVSADTQCVAGVHGGCVYAMVEGESADSADAGEAFEDRLTLLADILAARDGITVDVGFSSCVLTSADDLVRGLINARQLALRHTRKVNAPDERLPLPQTTTASLLGADPAACEVLARTLLAPVDDYDARRGTQYLSTLRTFLALDGHFGSTANELGIHINTLRYRLTRIESLTGRGLATTADRSDYYTALCLRESTDHS